MMLDDKQVLHTAIRHELRDIQSWVDQQTPDTPGLDAVARLLVIVEHLLRELYEYEYTMDGWSEK
jgi:hypothetical protein